MDTGGNPGVFFCDAVDPMPTIRARIHAWRTAPFAFESGLGLCGAILTAWLLRHGWSPFDDGVYIWAARRLLDGAVLHSDLVANHPGYSLYLDAWLFSIFGNEFSVLRYPLPLIAGILTASTAWLLRPMGMAMQGVAAFAAASLGVAQFITPSSGWYAVALATAAIAVFAKAVDAPRPARWKLLLLTGLLVGLCAGFRQLNGALLGVGLVILHTLLAASTKPEAAPSRAMQSLSLIALLAATCLMAMPALAAPSISTAMLILPGMFCAALALRAWRQKPQVRDVGWLAPVLAGCTLGFLPAVAVPMAHGALPGFIADTITQAATYSGYSALRGVDFTILFVDAIELFARGELYSSISGLYLLCVGLMPLLMLGLACLRRNHFSATVAPIVMLAAICLPISITYQGILYAPYWLPAVMAAILALAVGQGRRARKIVLVFAVLLAAFALTFLSGRVPGARLSGPFADPRYRQVACGVPHCDLQVDQDVRMTLEADYKNLMAHVPADRALMLLPNGASLYGSLPHPSPWSFSFILEGLSTDAQIDRMRAEFMARPDAVLAVSQDNPTPGQTMALDRLTRSLCLVKKTPRHHFFEACPE